MTIVGCCRGLGVAHRQRGDTAKTPRETAQALCQSCRKRLGRWLAMSSQSRYGARHAQHRNRSCLVQNNARGSPTSMARHCSRVCSGPRYPAQAGWILRHNPRIHQDDCSDAMDRQTTQRAPLVANRYAGVGGPRGQGSCSLPSSLSLHRTGIDQGVVYSPRRAALAYLFKRVCECICLAVCLLLSPRCSKYILVTNPSARMGHIAGDSQGAGIPSSACMA